VVWIRSTGNNFQWNVNKRLLVRLELKYEKLSQPAVFVLTKSANISNMTIKGFYLVGQSKEVFRQDIHIDQYHDFEALQVAVAEQYNIIQAPGK
jgi:hypothetical protein